MTNSAKRSPPITSQIAPAALREKHSRPQLNASFFRHGFQFIARRRNRFRFSGQLPFKPVFAHFAPTFGFCLKRLHAARRSTLRLFAFNHLRGLTAATMRLNIVGPMEAQTLQHRLSAQIETVIQNPEFLTLDDLAQTAPLLDLWQGAQDRLLLHR
ncbi:MAG TPA: urease accessory UreF family protein [Verrucomicrobiae bacterium]|nr:urease accessory UreF family protein [Verrucomicrobiae bacterium]